MCAFRRENLDKNSEMRLNKTESKVLLKYTVKTCKLTGIYEIVCPLFGIVASDTFELTLIKHLL